MRTIDLDGIIPENLYDEIHQAIDEGEDVMLTREDGRGALLSPATLHSPSKPGPNTG